MIPSRPHEEAMGAFEGAGLEPYFSSAYGWALFPTVGKGGFGVGGAYGNGQVYAGGDHVGNARMTQLSIGFQAGGQAFSQIIFFQNQAAFDDFTSGNFEFEAGASAVAITAGVDASARTTGSSAGASGNRENAVATGKYLEWHGDLHHGERWSDVRGSHCWPEVQLRSALAENSGSRLSAFSAWGGASAAA